MVASVQRMYFWIILFITSSDCVHNVRRPWRPHNNRETETSTHKCGISPDGSSDSRIVGGEPVTSLKYPWFAALVGLSDVTSLSVICAGTLITNSYLLSAGHCFQTSSNKTPESLYRVVFNLIDRCNEIGRMNLEYALISKVHVHPDYDPFTLRGDIALVNLATPVSIMPICLPLRNSITLGEANVIGFGSTRVKYKSDYPCILQQANIDIFSRQQCKATDLQPAFTNIPGTFCAGKLAGGVDSCDGDSGGPVQTINKGIYTIQGIVSFGEGCGRENLPGVYTRVSYYRGWIDNKIKQSNSGRSSRLISTIEQTFGHRVQRSVFGQHN